MSLPPTLRPRPRLLIADYEPTRLGIRIALGDDVNVCAEAGTADQAISAVESERPDICMVGLEIPGGGLVAVRGICAVAPRVSVVVLAAMLDRQDLLAAVHAGAIGYLPASIQPASLRRAAAAVASGEAVVPRSLVLALALELRVPSAAATRRLTAREAQVLGMLHRGHSTAGIAASLAISPVTVRRHISTLMDKIGVESRAALVTFDVHPQRASQASVPGETGRRI